MTAQCHSQFHLRSGWEVRLVRKSKIIASALLFAASAVNAEAPLPPPSHDASQARCSIQRFVNAVNRHDLTKISTIQIFANEIGQVSTTNAPAFFASFDVGTKLTDRDPLTIRNIAVLEIDVTSPIYLATLERKYSEKRYWAVWIFQFESDNIIVARRADELWRLLERGSFAFGSCAAD